VQVSGAGQARVDRCAGATARARQGDRAAAREERCARGQGPAPRRHRAGRIDRRDGDEAGPELGPAVSLRGQDGNRFEFVCPPNASAGAGPVWGGGTEYFTDASAVCPAAVMTGDILLQGGGLVVIEIRPGQPSYVGTTSNGITSQSSGPTPGSFVVIHDS
jgi:hypothetical protein